MQNDALIHREGLSRILEVVPRYRDPQLQVVRDRKC